MKRAIVKFPIYVKDDYEPGNCKNCPFVVVSSRESFPGCYEERTSCQLKFYKETCPITIKDNKPKDSSTERLVNEDEK